MGQKSSKTERFGEREREWGEEILVSTVFIFQVDEVLRRGRDAFRESNKAPCSPANSVEESPGSQCH